MTALKKVQSQQSKFTLAIKEWLSGEVTGHLGAYMYTEDSDDHRWKDGHSAESYYLGRDDKATFDIAINDLNLIVDSLYDLGPGGEASVKAKSIPLIRAIHAKKYFPIDLAPALAQAASTFASKATGVLGNAITADFFEPIDTVKPNALLAFMGGTLGNIETHTEPKSLLSRLANIFINHRKMVAGDSHMLVSFDANTNAQEVLNCYQGKQFDRLIHSCVDRAIDTDNFDYDVTWTEKNHQLALGLRAREDRIIKFDGEEFAIEKGEFLPVLNSYRYPVSFVKEAAAQAGWAHQKTWSATGRVHYLLFKAN